MNRMRIVADNPKIIGRRRSALWMLSLLTCASIISSLTYGPTSIEPLDLLQDASAQQILMQVRVPRMLCAFLVGFGLAVVGGMYQSLFKNYLASPFTLGVSSGAALVASVAIMFGLVRGGNSAAVGMWGLLGAIASVGSIVLIHRLHAKRDPFTLLLVGVVFSFFCSSLMALVQYIANYSELFQVTRWLMGGISSPSWDVLLLGFIAIACTFIWAMTNSRTLDLFLFGDDMATVKGVDILRETRIIFVITSIVVGWIVAQCGIIGFVGIVVPAIARQMVGLSHRRMLPVAGLTGASLVLACDTLGRIVISPFEIPAGVFTAVIGGPVFIWLVLRGR